MGMEKRLYPREPVTVPCMVTYMEDARNTSRANVLNLSEGGLMLGAEQAFLPNQKVAITLEQGYDTLLFEFVDVLTGTVLWSQPVGDGTQHTFHIGVVFDKKLPHRLSLTEQ